ncbi:MAG: RIP metalloprotease RseP [Betaproteobacteria bacterium]
MLTTIVSFAFVLGVLVFVHELGHFVAAKQVGVRVLKFQLGFNPTIVSFRRGDTEYGIGALPLGGYVKMAGDSPEETLTGQSDEFLSKSKWQRFYVLVMGPVMNLLLALVLTTIVLYHGAQVPSYQDQPPVVGVVTANSPAAAAGIQPGDRIQTVDGHDVTTWEQFYLAVGTRPNRAIPITFLRQGLEQTRTVTPVSPERSEFEVGEIGVLPNVHPHVPSVVPGDPAERAGVKAGDVILAVDDEPITFSGQLRDAIEKRPDRPIALTVLRGGVRRTISVTPARHGDKGWIGVSISDDTRTFKPTALQAAGLSVQKNIEWSALIFQTVWGLITRQTSPKQLMGPVAIAQLSGESAALGWIALFSLMATISLNLGLLNLLPIPVLDGGHIFIMALEGIARRDFSVRVKEKLLLAGFVVLMMLMVTVIYNDLARISWINHLMPWK